MAERGGRGFQISLVDVKNELLVLGDVDRMRQADCVHCLEIREDGFLHDK